MSKSNNLFVYIVFFQCLLSLLFKSSQCILVQTDSSIRFTNDSYTGYLSENIAQYLNPSAPSSPSYSALSLNTKRRNLNSNTLLSNTKSSIFVRFIDDLKPAIRFIAPDPNSCEFMFNLSLKNSGYDQDSLDLFEIDHTSYLCTKYNSAECICYIKIRLNDDPFIRDRINREARDLYQFQLVLNQAVSSYINVNILDDNDLEPMFDPSEYLIELNEFEIRNSLTRINLPEFNVIGKVFASDPDQDLNSRVKFYSSFNPYFGVNSNTGEVYLKKSLGFLLSLNKSEFDFEVKAIDSGLKFTLANSLIQSMSLQDQAQLDENADMKLKFVQVGSSYDSSKKASLDNAQSSLNSFESAQVKVLIKQNLNSILRTKIEKYSLKDLDLTRRDEISNFRSNLIIPYRVFDIKYKQNFTLNEKYFRVKSQSSDSILFGLHKNLDDSSFLVYFHVDTDLNQLISGALSSEYTISYCHENYNCFDFTKFEFNFKTDLIESISAVCSLELNLDFTSTEINNFTSINSVLFRPRIVFKSIYSNSNVCGSVLSNSEIFRVEYSLTSVNGSNGIKLRLEPGLGVVLDKVSTEEGVYKLSSSLYLNYSGKEQKINLVNSSISQILMVKYSRRYDLIEEVLSQKNEIELKKIGYDSQNSFVFDLSSNFQILNCKLVKKDGQIDPSECFFRIIGNQVHLDENMIENFGAYYKHALLTLKSKSVLNLLIRNNLATRINIKLIGSSQKQRVLSLRGGLSSNLLENAIQIAEQTNFDFNKRFKLSVVNESVDLKCFSIDQALGHIYLKCKLPASFLSQNSKSKVTFGQNTIKRVLEVTSEDKVTNTTETTMLDVYFDMGDSIKRLDEVALSLEVVKYSVDEPDIDLLASSPEILNEAKLKIKQLKTELKLDQVNRTESKQALVEFSNATFVNLSYMILNSSDCSLNKIIWQLDPSLFVNKHQDQLYLYNLASGEENTFKIDRVTGELVFNTDFRPLTWSDSFKFTLVLNLTEINLIKTKHRLITIQLNLKPELNSLDMLSLPKLKKQTHVLFINKSQLEKSKDLSLIKSFEFQPALNPQFNRSFSIKQIDSFYYTNFPFYIDSTTGQLFYFNSLNTEHVYEFQVVVAFKFHLNDKLSYTQTANIHVELTDSNQSPLKLQDLSKNQTLISQMFNLDLPVHSTDLIMYFKSPLIGVLSLDDQVRREYKFDLDKPKFRLIRPVKESDTSSMINKTNLNEKKRFKIKSNKKKKIVKKSIFELLNDDEEISKNSKIECDLINENFLSLITVDENSGAIYFNSEQQSNLNLYSKLAKLINYFYYEKNLSSKQLRLNFTLENKYSNITQSYWINLVFHQNNENVKTPQVNDLIKIKNNFKINSNNLLNMFRNGDEFLINVNIDENSPTWLSRDESFLINLREYFKSKLNTNKKNYFNYLSMLKNTRFYLLDKHKNYFQIEDSNSGVLSTKQSIQFDFEQTRSFLIQILAVQDKLEFTGTEESKVNVEATQPDLDDLVFGTKSHIHQETRNQFKYFIDLSIKIQNLIDEPFVCDEPIYFLNVDENEVKNKKLFTIKIKDFDQNDSSPSDESRFRAVVLSGNAQGLFHMNGLSLFTGSSARKLDRETRALHELDIKIIELTNGNDLNTNNNYAEANSNFNSSRFALCKIIVTVNDINDNRPIVNDLELSMYDKLDERLVNEMRIPIANAIAIDQDQYAKLTYSIVSIRILNSNQAQKRRVKRHPQIDEDDSSEAKASYDEQMLAKYFQLNTTTGALYSLRTEMPCYDCIVQVQYKSNDVGRFKTRVSRKSSIKLNIRKYPKSLLKLNEFGKPEVEQLANDFNTFELGFKANRSTNIITLNLNEDVKLGEKVYQIRTRTKVLNLVDKSILYFHLLEATNLNQTFYLSNHDGSLYLIKALDYDLEANKFNLTVLITNWIGQIELVYIEINVRDTNDNRPVFTSTSQSLHESILITENHPTEKSIKLVEALDQDDLDIGKLVFKLEDCFYMSSNLLLKKPYVPSVGISPSTNHLNFPLCSKEFIELEWTPSETRSQSLGLKIRMDNLFDYIRNSSDFYQSELSVGQKSSILFVMNISAKDTLSVSPGLTRVWLNISLERQNERLNESKLVFKRHSEPSQSKSQFISGFRKENYFVSIRSIEQLRQGYELIRLINEFVWTDPSDLRFGLNMFKPFDLKFNGGLKSQILIEPNFGIVYLNQTIFDLASQNFIKNELIFEIDVSCDLKNPKLESNDLPSKIKLYKRSKIVVSILKSVLINKIHLNDFIDQHVWSETQIDGYVNENAPIGTMINVNIGKYFNFENLTKKIQVLTPIEIKKTQFLYKLEQVSDEFELEAYSGVLRLKFEPDYELRKVYSLKISVCMSDLDYSFSFKTQSACFMQTANINIKILNRNDNEPVFRPISFKNEFNLNLTNPSELLRSMTLFKFETFDSDYELNKLSHELIKVDHHRHHNHRHHHKELKQCKSVLDLGLDSFELFKTGDKLAIKLTDLGFENFLNISTRHDLCDLDRIEIVCQVSDVLFTNEISFYVNLELGVEALSLMSIRNNVIAPILHTIELDEEIFYTQNEKLIDLEEILQNYLSSNLNTKNLEISALKFDLNLLNYEDLFYVNKTSNFLFIRQNTSLNREFRDTFELFVSVKSNKQLIPSRFRVLVKINDVNDNRPLFIIPYDVKYTRVIGEFYNSFYLNKTLLWSDLLISTHIQPVLRVEAIDLDLGTNSEICYSINSSSVDLFDINKQTGEIYFSQKQDMFTNQAELTILALDNGKPVQRESFLFIKFNFIQNELYGVYFKKNFYQFKIVESLEPNETIGYINSAVHFNNLSNSSIIYSIIAGDDYQEFKIQYKTGRLSLRSRVDYETKSSYFLIIQAVDNFNPLNESSNTSVRIDLIDINDQEPMFDKFEYVIEIDENLSVMSEIFRLNATDLDSAGSTNSRIRYKLLNHLDLFYVNEITGFVYNKQTFDYETEPRSFQLKVKAYDLGNIFENNTFVSRSLETTCLLTVYIRDLNDNPPQFEKSVYFSQIEFENENQDLNSISLSPVYEILIDEASSQTRNASFQFVTKVNAKDFDSHLLEYSILKQAFLSQQTFENRQIVEEDLFLIESSTGLVYLDTKKFILFKKFNQFTNQKQLNEIYGFNLQLLVNDHIYTSQARLNIQIKVSHSHRPEFKSNFIKLSLDLSKSSSLNLNPILDLNSMLVEPWLQNNVHYSINLEPRSKVFDLVQIQDSLLKLSDKNAINQTISLEIPLLACERTQSGLCDQILLLLNLTTQTKLDKSDSNSEDEDLILLRQKSEKIGFSYNYGAFTIQQQFGASSDYQESVDTSTDDYYYNDDTFESNERFYYELKTIDLSVDENKTELFDDDEEDDVEIKTENKKSKTFILKREFEITDCVYQTLNISLSNVTILKQIKQLTQSKTQTQLSLNQLKSLFMLNKHNGVLSSRKIINYMLPGIYMFNISLRLTNKMKQNQTTDRTDSTQFKLIILPSQSSIKSTNSSLIISQSNGFKFDREFYKFKLNKSSQYQDGQNGFKIGQINLINKFHKKSMEFENISYRLIDNKFKSFSQIHLMFDLDPQSGILKFNQLNGIQMDSVRSMLNEDNELVLHALATVREDQLEYMCEIYIDFNQYITELPKVTTQLPIDQQSQLMFGKGLSRLRLNENIQPGTVFYRLIALTCLSLVDQRESIKYSILNAQDHFSIDERLGGLKLNKALAKEPSKFNISACIDHSCSFTELHIDLIDINNQAPVYQPNQAYFNGTIREDALPGTVVATLSSYDPDSSTDGSKLEYFILNGDHLNQFAISPDGKVYTRLLLDRETISSYTLFIIVFDGKFKTTTKLYVKVLDVDDSRPVCNENLVNLSLNESLRSGSVFYTLNCSIPDLDTLLRYEIILEDNKNEHLPFGINRNTGTLILIDSLDYEFKTSYKFYVKVSKSNDNSDSISLKSPLNSLEWTRSYLIRFEINVLDVNDNRPELSRFANEFSLIENSPRGTILNFNHETFDLDTKLNAVIIYSIVNETSLIRIDPLNGLIQLNSDKFDREQLGDSLKFRIKASNLDNLSTEFDLGLNIIDVNDNKPEFDRDEYFISVQENLPIGYAITEIKAIDLDSNPKTEYYLVSNNSDKFIIEKNSGKVRLNGSIDYETENHYVVDIIALDPELNSDINSSKTRLVIDILDLNDNPPVFDPSTPSELFINENLPINSTIFNIKAFDLDKTSPNNKLEFRVVNGLEFFGIETFTGRLFNKIEFDFENSEHREFSIKLECSDNGEKGPLKTYLKLKIHIQDLNDNEPVFQRVNQTLIFKDSFPLGQEITKFYVTDKDSFNATQNLFSVMEQFKQIDSTQMVHLTEPLFSINPNGSLILIKKPFSNQTYIVKVRCYDSGPPAPLFTDSYLTIKITDESNNEPVMTDHLIDVVTVENLLGLEQEQLIGELKATDLDKQDKLFYDLNDLNFQVNKLNGLVKIKSKLSQSSRFTLRPSVTDKKFSTESMMNIQVKQISSECVTNSLYAKFSVWSQRTNETVSLQDFFKNGYLKRFKETLNRLLMTQFKQSINMSVEVIALRYDDAKGKMEDDLGLIEQKNENSIIEILFAVQRMQRNHKIDCLNSKYVSKVLNKKKSILLKRLKIGKFQIKLADMSFNHECAQGICSTNIALQNCILKFKGYNQHDLCDLEDSTNKCQLIPKHDWTCEAFSPKTNQHQDLEEIFGAKTMERPSPNEKYGQACKKSVNPCKNNGICKIIRSGLTKLSNTTRSRLHCFCPNGFKGKYCEEDINECVDSDDSIKPCHPSAKCVNSYGSYTCECGLAPSSLCFNTLSPQYSASVADLDNSLEHNKNLKNLRYFNSIKKFNYLNTEDDLVDLDDSSQGLSDLNDEFSSHVTLFGTRISNQVIQQALLGIFGAICAILVLLSLAAGIVCKINLSRSYASSRNSLSQRHDKLDSTIGGCGNTSNTSVDHEVFTSSTSSPCSYKPKLETLKPVNVGCNKYKPSRFSRNKQRSSMTTSLISSNTIESSSEAQNNLKTLGQIEKVNRKSNFRYNINNLLFARLNTKKGLSEKISDYNEEEVSSLAEVETSSAYSPQSINLNTMNIAKYKLNKNKKLNLSVVESSCLLEGNEHSQQINSDSNDADDEDCVKNNLSLLKNGLIRPVNLNLVEVAQVENFSSFGRASFKTKFNTLNAVKQCNSTIIDFDEKLKFNTSAPNSKVSKKNSIDINQDQIKKQPQHSTFLPTNEPSQIGTEYVDKDDSINSAGDCSLGFYWDITDWAGGLHADLNGQIEIETNLNQDLEQEQELESFSPIYSKVFKVNSKSKMERFDDLLSSLRLGDNLDDQLEVESEDQEEVINKKLSSFEASNYMFLTNKDDCDKTFESTNTNTANTSNTEN